MAEIGAKFRRVYGLGDLVYTGARWQPDLDGVVMREAKRIPARLREDAVALIRHGQPDEAVELLAHAHRTESRSHLESMVSLARTESPIIASADQFDADPWWFNCANGTVDLRTGKLRPHRPEDYITKMSPVEYRPRARCRRFLVFLHEIMGGRPEMVAYLQRVLGYALTGLTVEQVLFVFYGLGANGKTTLLETIRDVVGDYAMQTDPAAFLVRDSDAVRNDLARLAGARMVSAVELAAGKALDEALVKQVTGGDRVTARFLYREFFEYDPRFKLFLATNHKPQIRGADRGIWRRVRLIPFEVTIPPGQQDRHLLRKLRQEAPGILAWLVRGCRGWRRHGLCEPHDVVTATETYREQSDILAGFFAERCVCDNPDASCPAGDLYIAYRMWADAAGEKPVGQWRFGQMLAERGFRSDRTNSVRLWRGLDLREASETKAWPVDATSQQESLNGRRPIREGDLPAIRTRLAGEGDE